MARAGYATTAFGLLAFGLSSVAAHAAAPTLDAVKAHGVVRCGVSTGFPGFSLPDSQGVYRGLDVDVCRAVAAAMPLRMISLPSAGFCSSQAPS